MADMPYFLDANVPIYAAGKAHVYKEPCTRIMTDIADGRLSTAIDTEIIQEILYRFGALQKWETAMEIANSLLALVPIVFPITLPDVHRAIHLGGLYGPQGIRPRDVVHVAVMQNNGLTKIISTDSHFDNVPGIIRLDPLDYKVPGN